MKSQGLVSKKRVKVDVESLPILATGTAVDTDASYWFHRRILARQLKPVCNITYQRTARVSQNKRGGVPGRRRPHNILSLNYFLVSSTFGVAR